MQRPPKSASICAVFVTLFAWLAISNHCALGAATPKPEKQQDVCPFHAKQTAPEKQKSSADSPCCKILRAVAPQKHFAAKTFFVGRIDFARAVIQELPRIAVLVLQLDTGPPGRTSFVELSGSMQPHAPPVL